MPTNNDRPLIDQLHDGTYVPASMEECQSRLPRDRNPHHIRFSQMFLFSDPQEDDPLGVAARQYLVLQPPAPKPKPTQERPVWDWAVNLAKEVAANLRNPVDPRAALPVRIDSFRELLGFIHLLDKLGRPGKPIVPGTVQEVADAIYKTAFTPHSAPLASPQLHFALYAVYEQRWKPVGYTRGDLVSAISLAPGEQVTLEYHSWDKTTFKSEEELATESELRLTAKLNQRDTQEVVSELSTQMGTKLSQQFNLDVIIPLGEVPVELGAGVGNETIQQFSDQMKTTISRTNERTEEAAQTLKNQRKVRIEITRENGRDDKQTRVVVNTNRCHALDCYYFEIVANYEVETRLTALRPCLLVPFPRATVTRKWVLCHEFILRQALLDASFLPGFAAGKLLETAEVLAALQAAQATTDAAAASPATGADADFAALRSAIGLALQTLETTAGTALDALTHPDALHTLAEYGKKAYWIVVLVKLKGRTLPLRRLVYLALLHANPSSLNALRQLQTTSGGLSAREALRTFFATVTPGRFQFELQPALLAQGLSMLEVPQVVIEAALRRDRLPSYLDDDAGLSGAVQSAYRRLQEALLTPVPGGTVAGQTPQRETIPLLQQAEAQVEYERLRCHLEDYWQHYQQAIWLQTNPDERVRWLREEEGMPVPLLSDEILGFFEGKAAYPIQNLAAVADAVNFVALLEQLKATVASEVPQPFLLSLPTPGTVLETRLGQCAACEDYIEQSRALELQERSVRIRQEEAEVQRREKRLSATPPVLDDFVPFPGGRLSLQLDGEAAPRATGGGK